MTSEEELMSNGFRAIDHLIQGLPVLSFEKVRTGWANCKVNKADPPIQELLAALEWASRGEHALIETALTIYNGGEYLSDHSSGWEGTNILRHVMDGTDTPTFRRIMEAMLIARSVRHVRNPRHTVPMCEDC